MQELTIVIIRQRQFSQVVSDITMAADSGNVSILALLDLRTAFDTVDRRILIQCLHISHHVKGTALCWSESYVNERYQAVMYAGITVVAPMVAHGVPQGPVLGPLLFIMYTANIPCIVNGHQLMCLCYADDTQLYFHMKVDKISVVKGMVEDFIIHVHHWLANNRLRLNPDLTVVMWCSSAKRASTCDQPSPIIDWSLNTLHQTSFVTME